MSHDEMTIEELEAHVAAAKEALETRRQERLTHAVETIKALAKEAGLEVTIDGVPVKPSTGLKGSKVPAKYRCPETGKTWSGRGMKPNWMNGGDPEQFRI